MSFYIIGISCFFHDSSVSLIKDGEIICCLHEERFTRIKHDSSFPEKSLKKLIDVYNLNNESFDKIVFFEKPLLKFERLLQNYVETSPMGIKFYNKSAPIWFKEKLFQKNILIKFIKRYFDKFDKNKLFFSEHHLSHAASAFYPSPFKKAIVLINDGVGEWATTSVFLGNQNSLKKIKQIEFPDSLGLLYSSFTQYLGFRVNTGEYKVMGLAPYGKDKYSTLIKNNLVTIYDDGSYSLNMSFFNYTKGLTMINRNFENLFGFSTRLPEAKLENYHMDLAASIQVVIEEILINMLRNIKKEFSDYDNLCLAGGVALNCVANQKIRDSNIFKEIWIQPASGDAGTSLGAALTYHYDFKKSLREIDPDDSMKSSLLGISYDLKKTENELKTLKVKYKKYDYADLYKIVADQLKTDHVIGWFQGRSEFGPRSLGNRSILANPMSPEMQKKLNLKIKFREGFRPFAPVILEEDLNEWFNSKFQSKYMLFTPKVKNTFLTKKKNKDYFDRLYEIRSKIPAVTHLDYSARVQTVNDLQNFHLYKLIKEFKNLTNCPILINTSFNVRGEPIVETPTDAYRCFMGTEMDYLIINNILINKKDQISTNINHKEQFSPD